MTDRAAAAIAATRRLRTGAGFRGLSPGEQRSFGEDLDRIERALGAEPANRFGDPYALGQATPADLQRDMARQDGTQAPRAGSQPAPPPAPASSRPNAFEQFGATGAAVEAINFPGFVASLVTGTFQAIVDATAQQLREYSDLVANLSRSVDDFARDHVSDDQVREHLAGRHSELRHVAPQPGSGAGTHLGISDDATGTSPAWLEEYGLAGEELDEELVAGPLVKAGRVHLAEQRMQTLASMVLMGINRIVVDNGDIRAKLQFHANLREKTDAEMATTQVGTGIAARGGSQPAAQLMVSTVKANAQAEASLKANLAGEVRISFRTETFPLERFADSQAIQLLNRHARWRGDTAPAPAPAPAARGGTREET